MNIIQKYEHHTHTYDNNTYTYEHITKTNDNQFATQPNKYCDNVRDIPNLHNLINNINYLS